jgi:hypothetical protein
MKKLTFICLILPAAAFAAANPPTDPSAANSPSTASASPVEIKLDDAHSDPILGDYTVAPGISFTVSRDAGILYTQLTGRVSQPKVEIGATSDTEFFSKKGAARFSFTKGADGKVTSVTVHQDNAPDQDWPKAQ